MTADDDRALVRRLMTPPGDHSPEMVALLLGQSAGTISRLLAENKRLQDQLHTLTLGTGKKFADLMERARDAEQQAADSQHAVQIYCDDYNKAMAERDAAIARAEKAEAFGIRAERATLILADEFEMDGDTILRLKAERDAATARADALAGILSVITLEIEQCVAHKRDDEINIGYGQCADWLQKRLRKLIHAAFNGAKTDGK